MQIRYFYPGFNPGRQIYNPGTGGPASHPRELATAPRVWPTVYPVRFSGLGAMPRQVIGPTKPVVNNQYSYPNVYNNLAMGGWYKLPRA